MEKNTNIYQVSKCKFDNTVKPVLSGHLKIDKTPVLMENGSLMKVKSIAECSPLEHSAILLTCIKRQSVLETYFCVLFEWPLKTGFTVSNTTELFHRANKIILHVMEETKDL